MLLEKYHRRFAMFSHTSKSGDDISEKIDNIALNATTSSATTNMNTAPIGIDQGYSAPRIVTQDVHPGTSPTIESDLEIDIQPLSIMSDSSLQNDRGNNKDDCSIENNSALSMNFTPFVDPRMATQLVTPVNSNMNTTILNNSSYNNNINNSIYGFQPPSSNYNRQGSTSSLASSINSDLSSSRNLAFKSNCNNFTIDFLQLLMDMYQLICSDPMVTPFDTNNPPSGILNRVAKVTIEQAKIRQIEIGYEKSSYLITMVRQRLLNEVRKDGYLSRNASLSSLPQQNNNYLSASSANTSINSGNGVLPPKQFQELLFNTSNNLNANNGSSGLTPMNGSYLNEPTVRQSQVNSASSLQRANSYSRNKSNSIVERLQQQAQSINNNNLYVLSSEPSEASLNNGTNITNLGSSINLAPIHNPLFQRGLSRTSSPLSARSITPMQQQRQFQSSSLNK